MANVQLEVIDNNKRQLVALKDFNIYGIKVHAGDKGAIIDKETVMVIDGDLWIDKSSSITKSRIVVNKDASMLISDVRIKHSTLTSNGNITSIIRNSAINDTSILLTKEDKVQTQINYHNKQSYPVIIRNSGFYDSDVELSNSNYIINSLLQKSILKNIQASNIKTVKSNIESSLLINSFFTKSSVLQSKVHIILECKKPMKYIKKFTGVSIRFSSIIEHTRKRFEKICYCKMEVIKNVKISFSTINVAELFDKNDSKIRSFNNIKVNWAQFFNLNKTYVKMINENNRVTILSKDIDNNILLLDKNYNLIRSTFKPKELAVLKKLYKHFDKNKVIYQD